MNLIAGAIQKAGVDKDHALTGAVNALGEVDGGAPLLIHDADFNRVFGKLKRLLDPIKQIDGEAHFIGAVHFRFHDVDAAAARVLDRAGAFDVVHSA